MARFREGSKARKVTDYLASGKTLTEAQAEAKFGVQNFTAMISRSAGKVEKYGNHEVYITKTPGGKTAYGMINGTLD